MKLAKTLLTVSALSVLGSMALADQPLMGTVIMIDRINGAIAIQQIQGGTVGASTVGATEQYKIQDALLSTLHAGDKVTFSVSETNGTKTITKLEKR